MVWKRWVGLLLSSSMFWGDPLLGAIHLSTQGPVPYLNDIWEAQDGLPGNYIIAITQTQDGYLWLGTLTGLARFDGIRFTVFDESTTPELATSRIVVLFEDSQRRLWIGTESGGVVLAANGEVTRLPIGLGEKSRLAAACEDHFGGVWLYTVDGQLWRYKDGKAERFKTFAEGLFSQLRTVITDEAGRVWVGVDWGQFAFDPGQVTQGPELPVVFVVRAEDADAFGFRRYHLNGLLASRTGGYWRLADERVEKWTADHLDRKLADYSWGSKKISALCEDHDGNLIVGTLGAGLFWFDAQGQATALSATNGLSSDYILSLRIDPEGSLWVGTDGGGLNRLKHPVFRLLNQTRGWAVQSVCEDHTGGLWIGSTENGLGYWHDHEMTNFVPASAVRTVYVDQTRQVWAGTLPKPQAGALVTLNGTLISRSSPATTFQRVLGPEALQHIVRAIYQDRSGALWFGTESGLVRWDGARWSLFTTTEGLAADTIQAIAEDPSGNLWVGTAGGALNQLHDGHFTVFGSDAGLPGGDISALLFDQQGALWVGTSGRGLARFRDGHAIRFTTQEGLVSNFIRSLTEDSQGQLWVGSNRGVMRIEKKDLDEFVPGADRFVSVRVYGEPDGLPTPECSGGSQPSVCRAANGILWFPTSKGLASIDPASVEPNAYPPPVQIETVLVDGQPQSAHTIRPIPMGLITIPAGKQRLDIRFTSLNLAAPTRARFRYRLEGHEKDWIETSGLSREAHYSRLPPGKYSFHVTAANEDGVWNTNGSRLPIVVLPPFWRTTWFLIVASISALGLVVGFVYFLSTLKLQRQLIRLKQKEALEKERARIARDIHDQVGASLTQVALLGELVESDKEFPEEIQAHARQISRTARETTHALDEIVWTVNPSNDTLEGLVNYVCKYAQDYLAVAGLRYRLDVPAQLPSTVIPPDVRHNVFLAAKEAITNIVRHAQATAAFLRLRLRPGLFTLEIEDNGRGPAEIAGPRAQTRNGLRNMRKRMEDIGGEFNLEPGEGGGTVVRLSAPLGKART